MVRRLAFPPPPAWFGKGGGVGGLACAKGPLELPLDGGVLGLGAARGHTQALRKP